MVGQPRQAKFKFLGFPSVLRSFVKRDLLDVAESVMSKLIEFEDTGSHFLVAFVVWDRTSRLFVLKQIIRFASKREGITHTVYVARAWARLSCCVQAASAQQILNR